MNYNGSTYFVSQEQPITVHNSTSSQTRRGPWSPEEDKKLMELISIYGPSNWVRIASGLSSRTPKQCRERYHQNLKPSLNRAPISAEEGELIEKLVEKYGKKWAEISRHLNGRSDNAIKNWWNGGANRRRRASLANIKAESRSRRSSTSQAQQGVPSSSTQQSSQQKRNTPDSNNIAPVSQKNSQPSQYPQVQQLPQIAFNTSMFGNQKKPEGNETSTNFQFSSNSPNKSIPSRSASFDLNSNLLPPISTNLGSKRRLLEDNLYNRRHSSANTAYMLSENTSSIPHNNSSLLNFQANNNHSPYNGTPLALSNQNSRKNSMSQFEFSNLASSTSSRRSSIAPDFFPNPLKESINNLTHKRNISQNSFNSPVLTPSTRFSISSASGITTNSSNVSTNTSPITQFALKNSNSSSTSIYSNMMKDRERQEQNISSTASLTNNSLGQGSTFNELSTSNEQSTNEQLDSKKISISSLIN